MSKTTRYVQELQERLYRKGVDVDDTNDLQGGERDEWEKWLDDRITHPKHKLKLEQNHENR